MEEDIRNQTRRHLERLLETSRALTRHGQGFARRLGTLEEQADDLTIRLREQLATLQRLERLLIDGEPAGAGERPLSFEAGKPRSRERDLLRLLARSGIGQAEILDRLEDGSGWLRIDGQTVKLTAGQLRLAELLMDNDGLDDDDDFVAWKTVDRLLTRLAESHGATTTRKAIGQMVSMLRRSFANAGLNPWLVQSRRSPAAYRIALRRKPTAAAQWSVDLRTTDKENGNGTPLGA